MIIRLIDAIADLLRHDTVEDRVRALWFAHFNTAEIARALFMHESDVVRLIAGRKP